MPLFHALADDHPFAIAELCWCLGRLTLPERHRWAFINLAASAVLVFAIIYLDSLDSTQKPVGTYRWVTLLTVCSVRTIIDYWWCWSFYYPDVAHERPA